MDQNQIGQLIGIVAQATQASTQPSSPGWKTSEFWLHILSFVPMALGAALGASNPVTLGVGAIAVLGSSIYTASRSHIKSTGVQVAAKAAIAASDAINASVKASESTAQP